MPFMWVDLPVAWMAFFWEKTALAVHFLGTDWYDWYELGYLFLSGCKMSHENLSIFRLQDRYVYINLIFIFPLGNVSQPKVAIGYKIQKLLLYPSALPLVQNILQTKLKNVAGSYHCDAYSIIPFSLNTS